jgi:hypothetical protein
MREAEIVQTSAVGCYDVMHCDFQKLFKAALQSQTKFTGYCCIPFENAVKLPEILPAVMHQAVERLLIYGENYLNTNGNAGRRISGTESVKTTFALYRNLLERAKYDSKISEEMFNNLSKAFFTVCYYSK